MSGRHRTGRPSLLGAVHVSLIVALLAVLLGLLATGEVTEPPASAPPPPSSPAAPPARCPRGYVPYFTGDGGSVCTSPVPFPSTEEP